KAKGRKFEAPWIGPLVVVEEKHPDVYRLQHRDTGKMVHRTVNVERLAPFLEREQTLDTQPPERQEPVWGGFETDNETGGTNGGPREEPHRQGNCQPTDEDTASMTTISEDLDPMPLIQEEPETVTNDQPESEASDTQTNAQENSEDLESIPLIQEEQEAV